MLKNYYVAMTLFMLIKSAIAFETYGEHPTLTVASGAIATTPDSANHYCVSGTICTYTTKDKGWWESSANLDCADICSEYSEKAMTTTKGWIDCGWLSDSCKANKDTSQKCTITFPDDINTAPTAT